MKVIVTFIYKFFLFMKVVAKCLYEKERVG